MSESRIDQIVKAHEFFAKWLKDAVEIRRSFEALKMDAPEPVSWLLEKSTGVPSGGGLAIYPPKPPSRPAGVQDDWIWVPMSKLCETTMSFAILRRGKEMNIQEILTEIKKINPEVVPGSVYNAIARNEDKYDRIGDGKIRLKNEDDAALLHDGYA